VLRGFGAAERDRRAEAATRALAERLDERGCGYGRLVSVRLDEVARAYERLELKLNAVLMAVTATFLSVLAGLLVRLLHGEGL
jgi:hypothetical protein